MPRPIAPEIAAVLRDVRKDLLDLKFDAKGEGPIFRLATAVGTMTDLLERLLGSEHEHGPTAAPIDLQRFRG